MTTISGPGPVIPQGDGSRRPTENAGTGVQAAGVRAIAARAAAFYFRAPVKAFFRSRIDYTAMARAINPSFQDAAKWSWRMTTPAVLAHAVKTQGWMFLPNQVLPPLLANTFVGAVLYTAYLQSLETLHEPSGQGLKRTYPPPALTHTFSAGLLAGSIQSLLAAPLDALQVRFRTSDMLEGKYKSMWNYAHHKIQEIGLRGIFAGFSLSLAKDSLGAAVFFSSFEWIKSQVYYDFLIWHYGKRERRGDDFETQAEVFDEHGRPVIRPHYAMEPGFLLLAGVGASVASQVVQHPLTELQNVHFARLESLDHQANMETNAKGTMRRYWHAYEDTFKQCRRLARRSTGWRRYLYRGFFMGTVRQVPSTSAGLIAFELVRRKYAFGSEEVKIRMEGFDVLLT